MRAAKFGRLLSLFFSFQLTFFVFSPKVLAVVPVLVSESTGGQSGAAPEGGIPNSQSASLSADGNWVAFTSRAQDLSSTFENNDGGNLDDVYLWNRLSGVVELVSHNDAGGNSGNGSSRMGVVNEQGTAVAFQSAADDILPDGDVTVVSAQLYVYNIVGGSNELLSPNFDASDGGNGESGNPSISADGNFVVFESAARNLVSDPNAVATQNDDTNGGNDIFIRDISGGETKLISKKLGGSDTETANSSSSNPKISADGNFVVFESTANDLVSGIEDPTNFDNDIFLWERSSGTITMLSVNSGGTDGGDGQSLNPVISANGTMVAYETQASDLVAAIGDGNGSLDIIAWVAGTNYFVSVDTTGTSSGNSLSQKPSISADGTKLVFESQASDLSVVDNHFSTQVYLWEFPLGTLSMVSLRSDGLSGGSLSSMDPKISADGNFVAFTSSSDDLVSGVLLGVNSNVFLRNLELNVNFLMSEKFGGGGDADGASGNPLVDSVGRFVVYESDATDLLFPGTDENSATDLFLSDQPGLLQFDSDAYSAQEGDGAVTITVNRIGGAGGEVSVDYSTLDDSAIQPSDYEQAMGTLTWSDGELGAKTFPVNLVDDDVYETEEKLGLALQNVMGGAALGDPSAAELTISDDDEDCFNDVDDNANGDIDCQDSDCSSLPSCQEACDDNLDNDDDMAVDCDDSDCTGDPACVQPEICNNGNDDDGDTLVDCLDTVDCASDPACVDPSGDGDGDGVLNGTDNCPDDSNPGQEDTDGDGEGNACDTLENDCSNGVSDDTDLEVDCDDADCSVAANCIDGDIDGIPDVLDNCPGVSNAGQEDTDADGEGNACDTVEGDCDNGQSDDVDGAADCMDSDCSGAANCLDDDGDGVPNVVDNCPADANPGQEETDGDGVGNACDTSEGACNNGFDDDIDGLADCLDSECAGDPVCANPSDDDDGDGVANGTDNCPNVSNPGQEESDGDGIGNACDNVEGDCANGITDDTDSDVDCADSDCAASLACQDGDGDGEANGTDNCPALSNPGQEDSDADGVGDACDNLENDCGNGFSDDLDADIDCADSDCALDSLCLDSDGDGVLDFEDNCPLIANDAQQDSDGDNIGDACDPVIEPPLSSPAPNEEGEEEDNGQGEAGQFGPVPPVAGGGGFCSLGTGASPSALPFGTWLFFGLAALGFRRFRTRGSVLNP